MADRGWHIADGWRQPTLRPRGEGVGARPPSAVSRPLAVTLLATGLGLLLLLAGCAVRPAAPTATAIPLAATATPAPRHTRAPVTPTQAFLTPPTATATPIVTAPVELIEAESLLAQRTVEGFLAQLVQGRVETAVELYLSDAARKADAEQLLSTFEAPTARLLETMLAKVERVTDTTYAAETVLQWAAKPGSGSATQQMRLTLIRSRGLWLIDTIALGEPETPAPTP